MDLQTLSTEQLMALRSQAGGAEASPDTAPTTGGPVAVSTRPLAEMSTQELTALREKLAPRGMLDTAKGLYKAADAGAVKGVSSLVGAPGDISDLGASGIHAATNYVEKKLGLPETPAPAQRPQTILDKIFPRSAEVAGRIQQGLYGGERPYEPQGTAEEYAKSVGEFIPAALIGPGGVAARTAQAILPGVTSETLGRVTKDTSWEHGARTAGALIGSAGASIASRPSTATRAIREQMPEGVTPQVVDDAAALVEASARQGIMLSWPEALSQVAGRPVLTNTLRHLEAAPQTEAQMAEFFSQRPQQVDAAARNTFNNLSPPNPAPSTIGPAVGRAAEDTVNDVRGTINNAARPFYDRASTVLLTQPEMAQVRALPGFREASDAVRNDPQLNRYVAGLPEDSVGFLNEVKKYLDQQRTNAAAPVNMQQNMQRSAGFGSDATAVRDAAVNATLGTPARNLETALAIEHHGRERFLQPLLDGPLGKIAARDTTTKNAIEALFPENPLPNSAGEITRAVGELSSRNQRAARDLVRAHAESTFNEAAQNLQSGPNQAGGAKFAARIVGNPQQRENLEAAVTAMVPNGNQVWRGFNNLLETLEATGTRQGIGSRTSYNDEFLREAAKGGIVGDVIKTTANPTRMGQKFVDRYERWKLGDNLGDLATILTDPGSVNLLRAIARMPPGSGQAQSVASRLVAIGASSRAPEPVQAPRK